ncbi:MAG: MoaD/ThiS family protein [Chloroflexi bacterium]|nr:MoaD/ThiS family protein [Chloroflexota bacterium]
MRITIDLFGDLRRFLEKGQDRLELELTEGDTVAMIYQKLGIPGGDVYGASVNGEWADAGQPLAEGDRVFIFPPIAGGDYYQGGMLWQRDTLAKS